MGKISEILKQELSSVYCDTCSGELDSECEDCHRKSMNWGISDHTANRLELKILESLKG